MEVLLRISQGGEVMYSVNVYDCAGEFDSTKCATFEIALAMAQERQRQYPRKHVEVFNIDRCDYDTNGLTEGEREALDEVLS